MGHKNVAKVGAESHCKACRKKDKIEEPDFQSGGFSEAWLYSGDYDFDHHKQAKKAERQKELEKCTKTKNMLRYRK